MKGHLFRRFATCLYLHKGEAVFCSTQDMENTLKKEILIITLDFYLSAR